MMPSGVERAKGQIRARLSTLASGPCNGVDAAGPSAPASNVCGVLVVGSSKMNRIGIAMVLVLAAAMGCSDADVPVPPPSRAGELLEIARVQDPESVEVLASALR